MLAFISFSHVTCKSYLFPSDCLYKRIYHTHRIYEAFRWPQMPSHGPFWAMFLRITSSAVISNDNIMLGRACLHFVPLTTVFNCLGSSWLYQDVKWMLHLKRKSFIYFTTSATTDTINTKTKSIRNALWITLSKPLEIKLCDRYEYFYNWKNTSNSSRLKLLIKMSHDLTQ